MIDISKFDMFFILKIYTKTQLKIIPPVNE